MPFEPVALNLPAYPFKLTRKNNELYIFDFLRKKTLLLTPEEWVRQHFVQFLINQKKYPAGLIKLEGGLKINQLKKRTDIVVFNTSGKAILIVECKAVNIKLSQTVLYQAADYNSLHKARYLVVSNGLQHICAEINHADKSFNILDHLPDYEQLIHPYTDNR